MEGIIIPTNRCKSYHNATNNIRMLIRKTFQHNTIGCWLFLRSSFLEDEVEFESLKDLCVIGNAIDDVILLLAGEVAGVIVSSSNSIKAIFTPQIAGQMTMSNRHNDHKTTRYH